MAAGLALALAPAEVCRAQAGFQYSWNQPAGGVYASNANWTPAGVPDAANEAARFNLNAAYNVQLPAANVIVKDFQVAQGDVDLKFTASTSYTTNSLSVNSTTGVSATLDLILGDTIVNGNTTVGSTGHGTLNLLDATLTTVDATLGASAGSVGALGINEVSGWSVTGTQIIGAAGAGSLDVGAGLRTVFIFGVPAGQYLAKGRATTSSAVMGQQVGSSGTATVNGFWNTGDLTVGDAGAAELSVLGVGGLASHTVNVAAQPGSTGTVDVTGYSFSPSLGFAGSTWSVTGNLSLGGSASSAGGMGVLVVGVLNTVTLGADL